MDPRNNPRLINRPAIPASDCRPRQSAAAVRHPDESQDPEQQTSRPSQTPFRHPISRLSKPSAQTTRTDLDLNANTPDPAPRRSSRTCPASYPTTKAPPRRRPGPSWEPLLTTDALRHANLSPWTPASAGEVHLPDSCPHRTSSNACIPRTHDPVGLKLRACRPADARMTPFPHPTGSARRHRRKFPTTNLPFPTCSKRTKRIHGV